MAKLLTDFARLVGVPERLAEDTLHSERAARAVLTRRRFFGASAGVALTAAMVEGKAFTFASAGPLSSVLLIGSRVGILQRFYPGETISHFRVSNPFEAKSSEQFRLVRVGSERRPPLVQFVVAPGGVLTWRSGLDLLIVA